MDPGGRSWILIAEKNFKASKKQINNCVGINQKPSQYTDVEQTQPLYKPWENKEALNKSI